MVTDQQKLQCFLATRLQAMAAAVDPNDRMQEADNHWHLQHADIVRQQLQHLSWLAEYLVKNTSPNLIDFTEQLTCDQERDAIHAMTMVASPADLSQWQSQFRQWFPPQGSEPELF